MAPIPDRTNQRLTSFAHALADIRVIACSWFAVRSAARFVAPGCFAAALLCPIEPALAQFTQQGSKLVGTGASGNAGQGAVAVSADGNTMIVGGPLDSNQVGAAWVFTRSGGAWSQQGTKLVGSGALGNSFQGFSVALSADGNTAIVGAPNDNAAAGAAWVFTRSGGMWSQQGTKLFGTGAAGSAQQGASVALSADGNTAIVGGNQDNMGVGAAWVFTRSAGMWSQQGTKLVGANAIGMPGQGISVALSGDGNTAILGGSFDNANAGAAWVFTRSGGMWTQQGDKLVGTGAAGGARQGKSVALSGDGNTAILGGPFDNANLGAVWVFTRSGGMWSQQGGKLVGTGAVNAAEQGNSVALSGGGNTAIVGGFFDNSLAGAAWVFTRNNGMWTQQGNKLVGTGAVGSAQQGASVALSCNTAVVGGPTDNSGAGAAWIFVAPATGTHDFNGDCLSDVLWYNTSTGQVVTWLVNGTSVTGGGSLGSALSPWAIAGQRDFNGDGYADIVWRNGTTGQVLIWLLNGNSVIAEGSPGSATTDWAVAGTGDFNGDGYGDILWYNSGTGQTLIWLLNGTSVIDSGSAGLAASPWTIAGTGDFNGDGMTDILWYNNSTGQVVAWLMNGTSVIGGSSYGSATTPWAIVGTGDFNGDGFADILWRNGASGQTLIWLLNGTSVAGGGSPGTATTAWAIAQTGDFNGDFKSDILWYNSTTGQLVEWLLNGTSVIGGASPGSASNPWQVQGMNAD